MAGVTGYRVRQFAELTGVTVRALHYYDRVGLLTPGRSSTGYRMYRESDAARLEQIVALKFLGVPLKRIKPLLTATADELADALAAQAAALDLKRRNLEGAITAIREAEAALRRGEQPNLKRIAQEMNMQMNSDWTLAYFREETRVRVQEKRAGWTAEFESEMEREWKALFSAIRRAAGGDPGGPAARKIVDRFEELVRRLTGDDPGLVHGIKAICADRGNWPEGFRARMAPLTDEEAWRFLRESLAARASAGA